MLSNQHRPGFLPRKRLFEMDDAMHESLLFSFMSATQYKIYSFYLHHRKYEDLYRSKVQNHPKDQSEDGLNKGFRSYLCQVLRLSEKARQINCAFFMLCEE